MASVSIPDPSLSRDFSKKKRGNGSAKLKQIKLDVRREQWLSRVKKGCNFNSNGRVDYCPSSKHIASDNGSSNKENKRNRGEDMEGSCIQDNDSGSMINSPIQSSPLDNDESGNGFSLRSSSSSSVSTCFSGNVSEEEEEDGCLDDWEAVADALSANDNRHFVASKSPPEREMQYSFAVPEINKNPTVDFSKPEFRPAIPESHQKCRAWKPDDALRPRCLPGLLKQHCSPLDSDWHGNHKTAAWAWQTIISQPSQCLICYEDLDVTDTSFLPCSCAFRLCLFCHKKILEADARCPGCRKLYDHVDENIGLNVGANAFHILRVHSVRF